MNLLERVLGKVAAGRKAAAEQASKARQDLAKLVIRHARAPQAKPDENETQFLIDLIEQGVISEEEATALFEAARTLHDHLEISERPEADVDKAEKDLVLARESAKQMVMEAGDALTKAQDANMQRQESRQAAQRIVNDYPILAPMFDRVSWKPKLQASQPAGTPAAEGR